MSNSVLAVLADGGMTHLTASRTVLVDATGLCDRTVRKQIAKLRREGHHIITSPHGGYFIGTPEEWDAWVLKERRRGKSCMYKTCGEYDNQIGVQL